MLLTVHRGAPYEYKDQDTGKQYFSVSQVLTVLDPHAFDSVPFAVLEAAQQRGVDLHIHFGLLLLATLGLCEKPEHPAGPIAGYVDAMEKFLRERNPVPRRVEEPSVNDEKQYAGTPDCVLELLDRTLVDLKTGAKRAVHKTQLVAYRAMRGYTDAKKLATLYVAGDGSYELDDAFPKSEESFHWAWFQSGLTVLHGRRLKNL